MIRTSMRIIEDKQSPEKLQQTPRGLCMLIMGQKEGLLQTFRVWVQNQFHLEAEYRALGVISGQRFFRVSPVDSSKLEWGYPDAGDWIMPVQVEQVHLGQIRIKSGEILDSSSLARIFHFVDLSLAPQLYSEYLSRTESNMQSILSSKSFPFKGRDHLQFVELGPEIHEPPAQKCGTPYMSVGLNKLSASAIVLHGQESFRFRNIAQSIRERVGSYVVFLDFKDVASEMKTSQDYINLNHVCLFVSEEDLDVKENQKSIRMFLEEVVETEESPRPLLIFGLRSNEKFQELFGSKGTSFVQTISIDRWPLKTGDVTKVLDLILD